MRKADRLFEIIQILRRSKKPVTADAIAEELETSKRSVYRDIAALMAQRVPVRGEAGLGYVLERGLDMPPLMLTTDEIEAAVLGAQWVMNRGDPQLAKAARDLMAKIEASVPERLRPYIEEPAGRVPQTRRVEPDSIDLGRVRAAIHGGRKIALDYRDKDSRASQRVIWPILLGYFETTRLIGAWCETRQDFRSFRADRIVSATFLDERYPERPAVMRARWRAKMEAERAKWAKVDGTMRPQTR
ncbi:MAG: HTH domain-containing protein [Alphaproteobacteria bacterium]|nr:HTH domain-containing protein [Alphaproteobacteria bacterium]